MRKPIITIFILLTAFVTSCASYSGYYSRPAQPRPQATQTAIPKEVSIYDNSGRPTAFFDTQTLNIYLWNGKPVAYLFKSNRQVVIYGFNVNILDGLQMMESFVI